jgi:hypothetical protein
MAIDSVAQPRVELVHFVGSEGTYFARRTKGAIVSPVIPCGPALSKISVKTMRRHQYRLAFINVRTSIERSYV